MSTTPPPPTRERIANVARQCLTDWKNDRAWAGLLAAASDHLVRWPALVGVHGRRPVVRGRGRRALGGGSRVLAIKAAAHLRAGEALPSKLPVPVPVGEAVHAVTAQVTALRGITDRSGVRIIQQTPPRVLAYQPGCLTHAAYTAAWGEPPDRYWIGHDTFTTRNQHLDRVYARIGLTPAGHTIDFDKPT